MMACCNRVVYSRLDIYILLHMYIMFLDTASEHTTTAGLGAFYGII